MVRIFKTILLIRSVASVLLIVYMIQGVRLTASAFHQQVFRTCNEAENLLKTLQPVVLCKIQ